MRSDLDQLMAERGFDAFIIPSTEQQNPYKDYLTGGVHASAMIIKKRGSDPVLVVNPMEIDEAAKSGFKVLTYDDFNYTDIVKQHGSGSAAATAALWQRMMEHFDIIGRVTLYGVQEVQATIRQLKMLESAFKGKIEIVLDELPNIFALAYETKDEDELAKLRDVGRRTGIVARMTRDWLATHHIKDGQIVNDQDQPLTIGAVKRFVRLKLLEYELEDAGASMIFAQGRDAGVPHSRGEAEEVLCPGESIVFDLFPRQIGGGYYHDMTRTWCLGYAPEHIEKDFNLVLDVFYRSLEGITLGQPTKEIDQQVCRWFESAGHPTRLSTSNTSEGYVHSLGHGIGLNIHETPSISQFAPEKMVFKAGNVVTIEPGLYYPSKGYGIRVEDSVYLDESGQVHNLTDCPYELVIPLKS